MATKRPYFYPDASELTVVIRGANERTEALCTQIIANQLPSDSQLTVIHLSPFSEAVHRTFEIGIQSNRPWLIAIDADIIPLDDVVVRIREICGKMAPNAFVATPLFLCGAVGGLATRGLHCYNSTYVKEALSLVGELDQDLRPESRVHDAMVARGYTRECYAKIFGLHEFEQSAKHIYLKAMLRSRKDEFRDQIQSSLEKRSQTEPDCQVAIWGFDDAEIDELSGTPLPTEYDWNAPYPRFEARMKTCGFGEKPAIDLDSFDGFALSTILEHNYKADRQSLTWIRDILEFESGAQSALEYAKSTPILRPACPCNTQVAGEHS
jgi:hypothetical protein